MLFPHIPIEAIPNPTREPSAEIRTLFIAPMFSLPVLGSQDKRAGLYVGMQWAHPEKRLTLLGRRLFLVFEVNLSHTYGGGWADRPRDTTWNLGVLGLGRFETMGESGKGYYVEIGWGINLATRTTFDLDSPINSTPTAGFGVLFRDGKYNYQLGLRYYHISNAGLRRPNQGQNQIMMTLGMRF